MRKLTKLGNRSKSLLLLPALCLCAVGAQAQKVTGVVTDQNGEAVIGATVKVVGSRIGAVTDANGRYEINASKGATLSVSYVGFNTKQVQVDGNTVYVTLDEDNTTLNDLVVVGYGTQKKKLVTGATVQVSGESIAKLNTTNALTAMQAATPGVQITQSTAQPGGDFKVYIRGVGTTGNSAPLYVIDGVAGGDMSNINPADIESVDVLKDAASAAIYGARAANGVILVTTKQGKAGKTSISYDGYFGWSNAAKKPSMLNAQEYMAVIDELNYASTGKKYDWASAMPKDIYDKLQAGWTGTDWWDLFQNKNALQTNHSVAITGGSDTSKYSMSMSYTQNNGIMGADKASKYDRYTGRINSDHVIYRANGRDIVKIGENLSLYYNKKHELAESGMYWNTIHDCLIASPLVPAYGEDGQLYTWTNYGEAKTADEAKTKGWNMQIFNNPLERLSKGGYNSMNERLEFGVNAAAYLEVEPIKDLRYRGLFNVGYSSNSGRNFSTPASPTKDATNSTFAMGQNMSHGSSLAVENTISYKIPEFAKNNIDLMVGQSFQKTAWGSSLSVSNSVSEGKEQATLQGWDYAWISNMNKGTGLSAAGSPWAENALASFFGRVNWNYNETYMAQFIVRTDGSSNFARGKRWGTFPSVSAGWVVTNEKFMESAKNVMDFFKIRASWGQNGNCNIPNFYYVSSISYTGDHYDNSYNFSSDNNATIGTNPTSGAYIGHLSNPDVTWETSEQLDLGFDARFLNSRLNVNFDWYKKKTKDWLVVAPVSDIFGTGAPYVNGGDVENTGIELGLAWNDNINKDFKYHVNVNFATNHNEVIRIANAEGIINGPEGILGQGTRYMYRAEVGHPIGYFYGMETEGVWQTQAQIDEARANKKAVLDNAQPGDYIWKDYNNDGKIDYAGEASDRHEIGKPNPDVTLGINLGFEWKGLDFSISGFGAFGQQIMKNYRGTFEVSPFENYTTEVFQRWHGTGTTNEFCRLSPGSHQNNDWVSTNYMENGDFFKIQNLTIGYDFNKLWKSSPFQQLRFYVQGQNLLTFTGYSGCDPEIGSSAGNDGWAGGIDLGLYPTSRTLLFGVNIKF